MYIGWIYNKVRFDLELCPGCVAEIGEVGTLLIQR